MDRFQVLSAEQQEVLVEAINKVITLNQKEEDERIFNSARSNGYLKVGERTWWNGATRQGDQWVWRFSDEPVSFACLQIQIQTDTTHT